ncbi:hypothetical protein [Soonwooa sp.]|uniref:hypothetical protein n=1 Tax=Soonwooa sp. TaxID=1938592 RepID=UPI00262F3919|nr:hypothetical protein [Soonwooa sp.]
MGGNNGKIVVDGGRPTFVIFYAYYGSSNTDEYYDREKAELEKNFKDINAKVIITDAKNVIVKNKNLKKTSFTEESNVLFWDGKVQTEPIVSNGFLKSTEYFSDLFGKPKASSYYTDFLNKQEKLRAPVTEKITEKSKLLSRKYVNGLVTDILFHSKKGMSNLFDFNPKGVKSIKVTSNNPKIEKVEAYFDTDGKLTEVIFPKVNLKFTYENGVLRKMGAVGAEAKEFLYNDNSVKTFDDDGVVEYRLKDNFLLYNADYVFDDYYTELTKEVTYENNHLAYKESGNLNNTDFYLSNAKDIFPVKVTYYNGGSQSSITKTGNKIVEKMDKGEVTYFLNDKNLIEKLTYSSNEDGNKKGFTSSYEYQYY